MRILESNKDAFVGADIVPAWRMAIAPLPEGKPLTVDEKERLTSLTHTINTMLLRSPERYSSPLVSSDVVEYAMQQATRAVAHVAHHMPVICPPAGSTPLAERLVQSGVLAQNIYSPEIHGSSASSTGFAAIDLPTVKPEVLDNRQPAILFEDIGDTHVTLAELIKARSTITNAVLWKSFEDLLRATRQSPKENHSETFTLLAKLCEDANVLFLPVFTKRGQFTHALTYRAERHDTPWARGQRELIRRFVPYEIPDIWAVGAGLMDFGIPVADISTINSPVNTWLLRVGTSYPDLRYLTKQHQETILTLARAKAKEVIQ